MAQQAVAREMLCALRQDIARIEGRLAERLEQPDADVTVLRRGGTAIRDEALIVTGAETFDNALGGGVSKGALSEIHGKQTRDAGAAAGFALALCALAMKGETEPRSLLWVGTAEIFHEAGLPYASGLEQAFGLSPDRLLFAAPPKLADALWIAEEATRLDALAAIIVELRGNPDKLDLTATRRLHHRAAAANRPVFLLRQAAFSEPTAAPLRLVVSPAPATRRETLGGPLEGTIGNPVFSVSPEKNRTARQGQFLLEWNRHDLAFQQQRTAHSRRLVSLSRNGADLAPAPGSVVALEKAAQPAAAGNKPPRKQHTAHLGARRAG